jgi:hypothetical protein
VLMGLLKLRAKYTDHGAQAAAAVQPIISKKTA